MKPIETAARALYAIQSKQQTINGSPLPTWDQLTDGDRLNLFDQARAVFLSIREPDIGMTQAGAEIIRHVGAAESAEAHRSDAANTFRFMIDAALQEI